MRRAEWPARPGRSPAQCGAESSSSSVSPSQGLGAGRGDAPATLDEGQRCRLVDRRGADQDVHEPAQGAHRAEDAGDEVKAEEADEAPVQAADDEQDGGGDVECFHRDGSLVRGCLSYRCPGLYRPFLDMSRIKPRFSLTIP